MTQNRPDASLSHSLKTYACLPAGRVFQRKIEYNLPAFLSTQGGQAQERACCEIGAVGIGYKFHCAVAQRTRRPPLAISSADEIRLWSSIPSQSEQSLCSGSAK